MKMTLEQARHIASEIISGERGEIFDPDNADDLNCIKAISRLLQATKMIQQTPAPLPEASARRRK